MEELEMQKKCPCCNKYKFISQFWNCESRADGLALYCKKCQGEKSKASRKKRLMVDEKIPSYMKDNYGGWF